MAQEISEQIKTKGLDLLSELIVKTYENFLSDDLLSQ